jgi:hypothetical protein
MELHEPFFVQNLDNALHHELFIRDDHSTRSAYIAIDEAGIHEAPSGCFTGTHCGN